MHSSLRSVSVKGTSYSTSTDPDAFYNCIKMQDKANAYTDPGTIVYISQTKDGDGISIFGQGTDTKTITTDKYITIKHQKYTGSTNGNVIANSLYYQLTVTQGVDFYLQDYGGSRFGKKWNPRLLSLVFGALEKDLLITFTPVGQYCQSLMKTTSALNLIVQT
jgi:hypothetical protein